MSMHIERSQVLMHRLQRQPPFARLPPAQLKGRLATVKDREARPGSRTCSQGEQTSIRRAGDEQAAPAPTSKFSQYLRKP